MLLDETPPPNINNPDYPPGCVQAPPDYRPLGYLEWHAMSEARTKRGERQVWCLRCERFRWSSTPCTELAIKRQSFKEPAE